MKRVIALVLVVALIGCATPAQRQYQQLLGAAYAATQLSNNCRNGLRQQPYYARLNKILLLEFNDSDMLVKFKNKSHVTNEQAADIVEGMRSLKACQAQELEEFGKVHPAFVAAMASEYAEMEQDAAKLVAKTMTIAQANGRQYLRWMRAKENAEQTAHQIVAQYSQAHEYQLQQRQAALDALALWAYQQQQLAQQQQLINAMYRPVTTTCNWLGNFLNCTTF